MENLVLSEIVIGLASCYNKSTSLMLKAFFLSLERKNIEKCETKLLQRIRHYITPAQMLITQLSY